MREVGIDYFKKMIQGKRVALIGPAEYVCKELDKEHGKLIDGYDVVIRLNGMINYPKKELESYYGKKMNILASSFWYSKERDYEMNKKVNGDKYYKCERYANIDNYKNINNELLLFENMPRRLFQKLYNNNKELFDKKNNLKYLCINHIFSSQTHNFLHKIYNLNNGTTTGLLAIANILLCDPKELYVTGITFYKDMKHKGYYNDYHERTVDYESENNNYDNEKLRKVITGHNIKGEQIILKDLIKNKKISVDSYLYELYK